MQAQWHASNIWVLLRAGTLDKHKEMGAIAAQNTKESWVGPMHYTAVLPQLGSLLRVAASSCHTQHAHFTHSSDMLKVLIPWATPPSSAASGVKHVSSAIQPVLNVCASARHTRQALGAQNAGLAPQGQ